jgi:hypothetical protein
MDRKLKLITCHGTSHGIEDRKIYLVRPYNVEENYAEIKKHIEEPEDRIKISRLELYELEGTLEETGLDKQFITPNSEWGAITPVKRRLLDLSTNESARLILEPELIMTTGSPATLITAWEKSECKNAVLYGIQHPCGELPYVERTHPNDKVYGARLSVKRRQPDPIGGW